ncbi:hypothetical protein HPP92_007312 [Vanilla planifolia]|nr:hypothetical protein HPP92_007312 [Vanilla planifolia]
MNEYRLPNSSSAQSSMADIVLCKVHRKTTSMRELEKMAAMEYRRAASQGGTVSATSEQKNSQPFPFYEIINMEIKEEFEDVPVEMLRDGPEVTSTSVALPPVLPLLESSAVALQPILSESLMIHGASKLEETPPRRQPPDLPALQVPNHTSFDAVDPFMNQLRSPWLDQMWSPFFANLNNF